MAPPDCHRASRPEAMLLRPGTPFVDRIERFNPLGRSRHCLHHLANFARLGDDLWLGFRLCFIIEPDVPFADLFAPSRAELAASRRAQQYLPPRTMSLHVDAGGEPVDDPALLAILARPYRSDADRAGRGGDLNLASRPHILDGVIDAGSVRRSVSARPQSGD